MLPAKLTLSEEERLLMMNTRFILTKNAVLKKVELLLGTLSETLRNKVSSLGLQESPLFQLSPKIAKGAQYLELPWVMLDYPRMFTKNDVCAIRCFFWWGNYWTVTLHLAGTYLGQYRNAIQEFVRERTGAEDWYLSVGDDQWQHVLEPGSFTALRSVDELYWQKERRFLKLVRKYALEQWDDLIPLLENDIALLLCVLKTHHAPSL